MQFYSSCRRLDFNVIELDSEFEQCESGPQLAILSYEDVPIEPFRSTSQYHLSNVVTGISCIRTNRFINLDETSHVSAAIFLDSNIDDNDVVYVDIIALDTELGAELVHRERVSKEWNEFSAEIFNIMSSAKVSREIALRHSFLNYFRDFRLKYVLTRLKILFWR